MGRDQLIANWKIYLGEFKTILTFFRILSSNSQASFNSPASYSVLWPFKAVKICQPHPAATTRIQTAGNLSVINISFSVIVL